MGKSTVSYTCKVCGKVHKTYARMWTMNLDGENITICMKCRSEIIHSGKLEEIKYNYYKTK